MGKFWIKFAAIFVAVFAVDQIIKFVFLNGFRWDGEFFSLILTFNKGVAFSMFAFLDEWLKILQLVLIIALFIYLVYQKELLHEHWVAFALLLGAGSSNLLDRFIHSGVVDYVFWHKWFEFAVFNFADVMINLAVAIIFIQILIEYKRKKAK
ncbi:signal peptidase II [Campylobacter geochelonis]|uniref:Lipoprotein signal peptidase n=1 Tax=Campylobacter geochelonis TaxID=1780362 RepID=A0A128EDD9_9BACT|nr:signal peptidase II [Campylobacter geochelonis]QKF70477.1 prolipoprotein signal peptidase II [Campylobacter geochelonis]CZE46203.1 lipoprotein signal peptidase [Campylobacter geochelonis]